MPAILGKAKIEDENGDYEECLESIDEALKIDATVPQVHLFRAEVLRKTKRVPGQMSKTSKLRSKILTQLQSHKKI